MVFKPFTTLARQSFAKSFTHGYAQSLVAASQSSYASGSTPLGSFGTHASNRFAKNSNQFHNAFQTQAGTGSGPKAGHDAPNSTTDGGLAAYYAAWQQHQLSDDKEWRQFQFQPRIGWKGPSSTSPRDGKDKAESKSKEPVVQDAEDITPEIRTNLPRSYSTSALDDIAKVEEAVAEAVAAAEASEAESRPVAEAAAIAGDANETPSVSAIEEANSREVSISEAQSVTSAPSVSEVQSTDPSSIDSPTISETNAYIDHIIQLQDAQQYAEIPAVFERLLSTGTLPTSTAYNALLQSAIHMGIAKHQVVPKALNVYSDMLRRGVAPDSTTYMILIELLASRSLDVVSMKKDLEEKRSRFGGMEEEGKFMFQSNEAEFDILSDDNSLDIALRLFGAATQAGKRDAFSAATYRLLVTACADQARVDDMIRVYGQMETDKVRPHGNMFPPMISAFAASGNLNSAVECYNEYKQLAIANDSGKIDFLFRSDNDVYAALIKGCNVCKKDEGGMKFFGKILESFEGITENKELRLMALRDTVVAQALVQGQIKEGALANAFDTVMNSELSGPTRARLIAQICIKSADANDGTIATRAFEFVRSSGYDSAVPAMSMIALHVRKGDVDAAKTFWSILSSAEIVTSEFIEPTSMYAVALIGSGRLHEGISQSRHMFARIRNSVADSRARMDVMEEIDEGIEFIGRFLTERSLLLPMTAGMELLWMMIENGGLVTPVAAQVLATLGPEEIARLSSTDLVLALQVQVGMLANTTGALDIAGPSRFAQMVQAVMISGLPVDKRTSQLVTDGLNKYGRSRPDLVLQWQNYLHPVFTERLSTPSHEASLRPVAPTPEETFDPYASTTDFKGSNAIAEELEGHHGRSGSRLDEALIKFKNMRRAGKHPRYITYAKLISAAAKEGRVSLVHDVVGMARNDIPLLPQYRLVRHGWVSILDSMVAACLTIGDRNSAGRYHQELLNMGAAPSANTFGLYITTLKESTKTFDEATEAVKIFHRSKSEGVEPSSFLYNALIGKLGKARRIDDCLFYFAEMRALGIRPTSVTYGTVVNALCRVSDEKFAEELFEEMESMPNYKSRPAPYNSLMQYFLTTKRDRSKVLAYYERMKSKNIVPTMHTYKLLVDTYATLEPVDMTAAENVLSEMRQAGQQPEAVHYASLIHAKGCVLHDMAGARSVFDDVLANKAIRPLPCLYQALFEAMVANHCVPETEPVIQDMYARRIEMTPYIANTLIHGWALEKDIVRAKAVYDAIGSSKREPSTYEAMTRAFLSAEDRENAMLVVQEMLSRAYPTAVTGKVLELVAGGATSSVAHEATA